MNRIPFCITLIVCFAVLSAGSDEPKHNAEAKNMLSGEGKTQENPENPKANDNHMFEKFDENSFEIVDFGSPPKPARADSETSRSYKIALEAFKAQRAAEKSAKSAKNQTKPDGSWAKAFYDMLDDYTANRNTMRSIVQRRLDPFSKYKEGSKHKTRKSAADAPEMPTQEELDVTYKYEVLPPPDNSPVRLNFPASPAAQGEEHLSRHTPLPLYCDACRAIAFQLHLAFDRFHRQVTRRPPTESEVYHLAGLACQPGRFRDYGMLETAAGRHISGPGCNASEAAGGVKHSRGPWPVRLAERCEEVTEDVGELQLHGAWLDGGRQPEPFKEYMCDGEPPRDYCRRYGHHDWAPETEDEPETTGDASKHEL